MFNYGDNKGMFGLGAKLCHANFLVIDQNLAFVWLVANYLLANSSSTFWPKLANSWADKTTPIIWLDKFLVGKVWAQTKHTAPSGLKASPALAIRWHSGISISREPD